MRRCLLTAAVLVAAMVSVSAQQPAPSKVDVLHYQLQIEVDPANRGLKGVAEVQFEVSDITRNIPFELTSRLSISTVTEAGSDVALPVRFDDGNSSRVLIAPERPFAAGRHTLRIAYDGGIERQNYSFLDKSRLTNGYIDDEEAFLMFAARWFPVHDPLFDPATFKIAVTVPLGFTAVVGGTPGLVQMAGLNEIFQWESTRPVNQLSLIVGRLRQVDQTAGDVRLHFFLAERDASRAQELGQQLSAILDYYRQAIGPYPFGHLTVVKTPPDVRDEMAGPGVLYLPQDLLAAPPVSETELDRMVALQWWGLGIMPETPADLMLGEGFAYYYAAQYLESRSKEAFQDEMMRLAVLALKYETRSSIRNALSLGFRSEEYESIVGGKGAWVLYMLEDVAGKEKLHAALKEFAGASMGRQASLLQFQSRVSSAAGQDMKWFFSVWTEMTGVPELEVDYTVYKDSAGGFRVAGSVKQNLELFRMPLRVAVETKDKKEVQTIQVAGKTSKFDIKTSLRPTRVLLDPEQKLLRNSVEMEVSVHIALGYELFQKNQFLEAIREYERAIRLNPRSSLAHYRTGEVFFEQANTQSAGNAFRDGLNGDLQPKWVEPMCHLQLGKIFDMLGERQRALAEYQKVINSKDNTFGAVDQADQYSKEPFTKKTTVMDGD